MKGIDTRARAVVRTLTTYRPGTPIRDAKEQTKRRDIIKLASNENALGPSPKGLAAMRRATNGLHRYPDAGCRDLREKLARHLRVDPAALIFGNGSDELIVLALRAFVDPGDEVVVAQPTFLIYELQAKACGATVQVVPMKDARYDLLAMKAVVTKETKLVFIANPDNPMGTYVTQRELDAFLKDLPGQTIVFLDEAYYEFVEADDYPQTLAMINHQPLIVTRSFSKAYGLAGLRIGYGIGQPSLIAAMDAVREPFNVNSLAQAAAEGALADSAYLLRSRRLCRNGRAYLMRELKRLEVTVIPSVTNFILLEVGPNAQTIARRLMDHGVIVREMGAWKLPRCLRVTIGTMPENRRFIAALKKCLALS